MRGTTNQEFVSNFESCCGKKVIDKGEEKKRKQRQKAEQRIRKESGTETNEIKSQGKFQALR